MAFTTIVVGSSTFRVWDLGGGVILPVQMLADFAGNQVTLANPTPVSGGYPVAVAAQINSGTSLSAAIDMGRSVLSAAVLPAAWDAAVLSFQGSADGTTYVDLFDVTTERTMTMAGVLGKGVTLDSAIWSPWRYLKLRSGTTGTPVNQTANRAFTLIGV
jgi:hypothetical protein